MKAFRISLIAVDAQGNTVDAIERPQTEVLTAIVALCDTSRQVDAFVSGARSNATIVQAWLDSIKAES